MKIGNHVNKISGKSMSFSINEAVKHIKEGCNYDMNTIAIFVAGPYSHNITIKEDDYENIKKTNMDIYVHNSYIANPWKNDHKAINAIQTQLKICGKIGAKGFIIHLPKDDIDNIIKILPKLYNPLISTKIYLEIPALKPINSQFHKTFVLNELFKRIKEEIDPDELHFGLCIDTAHLWSSGLDISMYKNTETWLHELNLNPSNIIIHCNDNDKLLGHAPDIHQTLTHGKIWNSYKNNLEESGLFAFLIFAKLYNIPIIFERKHSLLINDYIIIQQLI
jgi:endonuclease IV